MTFSDQLRPLVVIAGGSAKAAELLKVTPQVVNRWLRGLEPVWAMQVGVLQILGAVHTSAPLTEGKEVSGGVGPMPTIPKPPIRMVAQQPARPPMFGGMFKAPKKV